MNFNQLKLNLNTMQTTRKRSTRRGVTKKYTLMLTGLQEIITLNEVKAIAPIIRSYSVSNSWGAFLIQNNIVFRDIHDNYKWNNKTPISNKLIQPNKENKLYHLLTDKLTLNVNKMRFFDYNASIDFFLEKSREKLLSIKYV